MTQNKNNNNKMKWALIYKKQETEREGKSRKTMICIRKNKTIKRSKENKTYKNIVEKREWETNEEKTNKRNIKQTFS